MARLLSEYLRLFISLLCLVLQMFEFIVTRIYLTSCLQFFSISLDATSKRETDDDEDDEEED